VELERGTLGERPWAITLATLARRQASGQLTVVTPDQKRYSIAFDRGAIAAAKSPLTADSIARVALTRRLVSSSQVAELARRIAAAPSRDEIDLLGELANLTPNQVHDLRIESIIRRAARTFSLEAGQYIFEDKICLPLRGCAIDIRAVVFHGIRMHLPETRLAADLRALGGTRFILEAHANEELQHFGFTDDEWPILAALKDNVSLPELEARHREIDPRAMRAAVYALVACGTARVIALARTPTPSIAIARTPTPLPPPAVSRAKTNPELAAEAAERATRALANDKVETAVLELKKAVELVPTDVDYNALLGWALFCASDDKMAAAMDAKRMLEKALHKSQQPHVAHFYLGRVERMLGHDREALRHFQAVLDAQPNNRDASAEIRVLEMRLRRQTN
jgi:hypothetical protein